MVATTTSRFDFPPSRDGSRGNPRKSQELPENWMIHAQANLKAALQLSQHYERAWQHLNEAITDRDIRKVGLANEFIDSDEFDAVPTAEQYAMLSLLATALLATGVGAP